MWYLICAETWLGIVVRLSPPKFFAPASGELLPLGGEFCLSDALSPNYLHQR
jgi:hypothetical protein